MTHLEVNRAATLPPLSWLLEITDTGYVLFCGDSVETTSSQEGQSFYEGCWAAERPGSSFLDSANFFGSGACIQGEEITFATSTHTLDALFVLSSSDRRVVSNSLAFLIRRSGLDLARMTDLPAKFMTILHGLSACERVLYRHGPVRVERFAYCNLRIGSDGITTFDKPRPGRFASFSAYETYLVDVLAKAVANAADPKRRARYVLQTTCSTGYDSVACAALAARLGCQEAITLRTARHGLNDSGAAVATMLDLDCVEIDRPERSSPEDQYLDAEFLASFCPGDCSFHVFDGYVRKRVLLTGHHGDKAWRMAGEPEADFKRHGGGSGMGLHEFRLRNDCLVIPVPYIGAIWQPDLHAISRSQAMRTYSVGGSYDRPIPRRIAEEAGVQRDAFGNRKAVASLAFWEWRFSDTTLKAADRFAQTNAGAGYWLVEHLHRTIATILNAGSDFHWGESQQTHGGSQPLDPRPLVAKVCRRISRRFLQIYRPVFAQRRYRDYITLWALREVGRRYGP